ncbi:MAG: domain found in IF2B/IF5-domain-containing protein [Benjaminiella poitrasii]|nr:MAG: domain found in IF2B/IF5-domain-containing protein [Benjaminiella poitrasii]
MATINVRRDVQDSFYRYKMPRITAKVEGKGNGIKTVITNMTEIARALSRPPSYPTKYFGCELGAQVKCDDKNERYIVNGDHDAAKLQNTLDGFINKFVLCHSCKNPETDIIIKNDEILMDCKACGARNTADMRHKLSAFIVKNPPAVASKNVRKQRKAATAQANNTGEDANDNASSPADDADGSDDDIISQRIQKQAAGLNMESKLALEDWSEDTSEAAVAQRMKELSVKGSGAFGGEDDDEDATENKYESFGVWLLDNKAKSDNEITEKAEELGVLGKYKACQVLAQGLFDENIIAQIPKRGKLLQKFVSDEKSQKATLGGIERLVGNDYLDSLLKKVPTILMKLYDLDIIEDEVFLKWGEKPSKRYVDRDVSKKVKKAAAPFLDWLENASEEEDSDEEDSE